MKAVQLSHDHQKLRAVAQEYARDHNITLPPGMQNDRGKDRYADRDKQENLGDKQREERTGVSKPQLRREIAEAWHGSDSGKSFIRALEEKCYYVARGDRRSYVVVDLYGEVHNLAKQIDGIKTKDIKARLVDHPLEKLIDVATAQDRARQERQARLLKTQHQAETQGTPKQRRDALEQAQAERREKLEEERRDLADVHTDERKALAELQTARSAAVLQERAARQPKGVMAFLARITGFNALTAFLHAREDRQRTAALLRRHRREMQNFRHQESALGSLDKREQRSLETALRREALQRLRRADRSIQPEFTAAAMGKTEIRKGDDERKEKLKKDFAAAAKGKGKGKEAAQTGGGESKGSKAADAFKEAAKPSVTSKGDLQRAYELAKSAVPKPAGGQPERTPEADTAKTEQARKAREELERRKPPPPGPDRDRGK